MIAAQKLNEPSTRTIHGGVSNGRVWNFGKLEGQVLTQDPRDFTISELPELFAALNYIFQQARDQALAPAA